MREVTTRKAHICTFCHKRISAGSRAMRSRTVQVEYNEADYSDTKPYIFASTDYYHAKCTYKLQSHNQRFASFAANCQHPKVFQHTEYDYSLPGSINGDRCGLCARLH